MAEWGRKGCKILGVRGDRDFSSSARANSKCPSRLSSVLDPIAPFSKSSGRRLELWLLWCASSDAVTFQLPGMTLILQWLKVANGQAVLAPPVGRLKIGSWIKLLSRRRWLYLADQRSIPAPLTRPTFGWSWLQQWLDRPTSVCRDRQRIEWLWPCMSWQSRGDDGGGRDAEWPGYVVHRHLLYGRGSI